MAKEIIPPTPLPVKIEDNKINDSYCATYVDYSYDSLSDTSKELLSYLANYANVYTGGTTGSYIVNDTNIDNVREDILNANISGINQKSFDSHIMLNQYDNDVMIFVTLY